MKKNVSGQRIGAQMVSATDGSAFTGSVTISITLDAGTQATGTVGSGACAHEGNGYHTYAPSQAETNGDLIAFTFTGTGAIPQTVQVYTSFPQTGDSFDRLGAPAGASVSADIAAIEAQTDDIGSAGAGLSAVPWNAAWDAEVQSEVTDALNAYDPPTRTEATSDKDEVLTRLGSPAGASVSADVADVEGKVDDLEGRLTSTRAGYLDNLSAGAVAQASALSSLDTKIGSPAGASVSADIAAIEAQTDDIGTAGAGLTAIPWNAAWDAEIESEVADALESTIADSVPADGTRPSVKQALYMLTQFMLERSVSSTTVTVRKPDGSTSLFTLTLNDATTPTSITRAS
jgi:hypothetical protein